MIVGVTYTTNGRKIFSRGRMAQSGVNLTIAYLPLVIIYQTKLLVFPHTESFQAVGSAEGRSDKAH
jgi:hypothetical protein